MVLVDFMFLLFIENLVILEEFVKNEVGLVVLLFKWGFGCLVCIFVYCNIVFIR